MTVQAAVVSLPAAAVPYPLLGFDMAPVRGHPQLAEVLQRRSAGWLRSASLPFLRAMFDIYCKLGILVKHGNCSLLRPTLAAIIIEVHWPGQGLPKVPIVRRTAAGQTALAQPAMPPPSAPATRPAAARAVPQLAAAATPQASTAPKSKAATPLGKLVLCNKTDRAVDSALLAKTCVLFRRQAAHMVECLEVITLSRIAKGIMSLPPLSAQGRDACLDTKQDENRAMVCVGAFCCSLDRFVARFGAATTIDGKKLRKYPVFGSGSVTLWNVTDAAIRVGVNGRLQLQVVDGAKCLLDTVQSPIIVVALVLRKRTLSSKVAAVMANSVNQRWTQIRAVAQPKLAQCPFAIPSVRYEWLGKGNVCTFLFDMPQVVDGFAASKSHNDLLGMLEAAASNAACGHPDKLAKTLGEEDAVTCDLAMSLQCPLTMVRIRLPARSLKCKHPSCFDLESFLTMIADKASMECPICSESFRIDDLVVMPRLLQAINSYPSAGKLVLHPDGSYTLPVVQTQAEETTDGRSAANATPVSISLLGSGRQRSSLARNKRPIVVDLVSASDGPSTPTARLRGSVLITGSTVPSKRPRISDGATAATPILL